MRAGARSGRSDAPPRRGEPAVPSATAAAAAAASPSQGREENSGSVGANQPTWYPNSSGAESLRKASSPFPAAAPCLQRGALSAATVASERAGRTLEGDAAGDPGARWLPSFPSARLGSALRSAPRQTPRTHTQHTRTHTHTRQKVPRTCGYHTQTGEGGQARGLNCRESSSK